MANTTSLPTLQDVAAAAGVSTATVSRVINFPAQVAPATRAKVEATIAQLGYSPHFGARVMAARRTNTVGAIIPTMENAVFARGLQAFQDELSAHGYTMLVASTGYSAANEAEQVKALVARGADALLLIGHKRDQAIYDFLAAQGIPTIITWAFDPSSGRPSVGFDNAAAMRDMARQVIDMGHRQLALISAETASNDRAMERYLGIQAAMQDKGLPEENLLFIETSYGIEEGAIAFKQAMSASNPPSAVFCGNDVLAVGALRQARDSGIHVPDDVSIIGFDDIELAQVAYPPLTTVHVPHREMGRLAAAALIGWLKDGTPPNTVELLAYPVMRSTLAPKD
ncbi:LacI family DNA-binding transcriptional regulator [Yoonia litorea]|nr:LacI family DNA-binding transcriptional regulator [Yoonia litorea]